MTTGASVNGLLVVVPARNEEALIGRCLDAIDAAVGMVRASRPDLDVAVVVVADRCLDRTADIASETGAHVVRTDAGCVGAARRLGVDAGIELLPGVPAEQTWIASTDADTRVPPAWLEHQVALATRGARLVIGRAVPDRDDLAATTWTRWHGRHTSPDVAAHIHGANLGFRLDDYHAAGGWSRLHEHEDRHLVDSLLVTGVPAAAGLDVITSGRLHGRVLGGFSGYLRTIEATPPGVLEAD
jgi:glycosyltransferase involved in cell wall biosynthesis